jgi:hypothetical protein
MRFSIASIFFSTASLTSLSAARLLLQPTRDMAVAASSIRRRERPKREENDEEKCRE